MTEQTATSLLPCFYCTGEPERYGAKLFHGIQCLNCGLQLCMTGTSAYVEIAHIWNKHTRAQPAPVDRYDEGYQDGKNHYCKIANKNMEGISVDKAPESLYVDGCGSGTYTSTPARNTIEYIRHDLCVAPVDAQIVEALTDAKLELWDEWHSGMSEEAFNSHWLIVKIEKALSLLKKVEE